MSTDDPGFGPRGVLWAVPCRHGQKAAAPPPEMSVHAPRLTELLRARADVAPGVGQLACKGDSLSRRVTGARQQSTASFSLGLRVAMATPAVQSVPARQRTQKYSGARVLRVLVRVRLAAI
ncbi:hypothetical protein EYF80_000308 [Liparis tanakae]|uniref:Uncharacterized protein n=1 Tax=Liparis tanakae TaxID=230148 RepID=A0A4Z2JHE4_9TELE|nr:hypothetical protein EYF80_000308 [Liparis tanakae]